MDTNYQHQDGSPDFVAASKGGSSQAPAMAQASPLPCPQIETSLAPNVSGPNNLYNTTNITPTVHPQPKPTPKSAPNPRKKKGSKTMGATAESLSTLPQVTATAQPKISKPKKKLMTSTLRARKPKITLVPTSKNSEEKTLATNPVSSVPIAPPNIPNVRSSGFFSFAVNGDTVARANPLLLESKPDSSPTCSNSATSSAAGIAPDLGSFRFSPSFSMSPVADSMSPDMNRSDSQSSAGLQHPLRIQSPSTSESQFAMQRKQSPLPLSLPSMMPPGFTNLPQSSRFNDRHMAAMRAKTASSMGPTSLAAPTGMIPSPSISSLAKPLSPVKAPSVPKPTPSTKPSVQRSTSPERPPVSPITPPQVHVKPEASSPALPSSTIPATQKYANIPTLDPQPSSNLAPPSGPVVKTAGTRIIINTARALSSNNVKTEQNIPIQSTPPEAQLPPRPELTHNHQQEMTTNAIEIPAPLPIDFETNPDVIALQNAIAILQMQARRAQNDIITIQRAKNAALENPEAFTQDLATGAVRMATGMLPGEHCNTGNEIPIYDDSSNSSSSNDASSNDDDDPATHKGDVDIVRNPTPPKPKKSRHLKPAWANLPSAQNVVRCPPINWSQYAVVGESLDRLHAEQVHKPNGGAPAIFTANGNGGGTYEFKGVSGPGDKYLGVAAPYVPGRDVLPEKKRNVSQAPVVSMKGKNLKAGKKK